MQLVAITAIQRPGIAGTATPARGKICRTQREPAAWARPSTTNFRLREDVAEQQGKLPRRFHAIDDLDREAFKRALVGGCQRLASLGDIPRGLGKFQQFDI